MDKRTFEERSLGCARRLYGVSYAILGNSADCEDAVSEALLRAWAARDSLREPDHFETWLTRILINVSKNMLRQRQRRRAGPIPESAEAPRPPDPALSLAVQALPIKYRLPLILHHVEGYSVAEIAGMLRLPQSTVKWRLHQARQTLRAMLSEGGNPL